MLQQQQKNEDETISKPKTLRVFLFRNTMPTI